jgi:hypothetical protein
MAVAYTSSTRAATVGQSKAATAVRAHAASLGPACRIVQQRVQERGQRGGVAIAEQRAGPAAVEHPAEGVEVGRRDGGAGRHRLVSTMPKDSPPVFGAT